MCSEWLWWRCLCTRGAVCAPRLVGVARDDHVVSAERLSAQMSSGEWCFAPQKDVLIPPVLGFEDQPKAPSEVDPERWLDVSMASPPPPSPLNPLLALYPFDFLDWHHWNLPIVSINHQPLSVAWCALYIVGALTFYWFCATWYLMMQDNRGKAGKAPADYDSANGSNTGKTDLM